MNSNTLSIFKTVIFSTFICLFITTSTYGVEYEGLDGLKDVKVVFDVRAKKPKKAAIYLDLIHETFKDQNIRNVSKQPDFVVVFAGGLSKFVSSNTEGFSNEEKVLISRIVKSIRDGKGWH